MSAARPPAPITTSELETRLLAAIDALQTLRCSMTSQERVNGHYLATNSVMKFTASPLRVYFKNQKGQEVLYVAGQNDGDAWVYPAAFPYLTLSLDPQGSLMRRDQHHTVLQAGFGLIGTLLHDSEPAYVHSFRYAGDSTLGARSYHVLRSSFPAFRYAAYRAGTGETTASVATKMKCGEYRILERNKLGAGTRLALGQVVLVPTAYGRATVLLIDQRTYLPATVAVYDDQGLYERYDFSNVVANEPIPLAEFSKDFRGYKL